MIDTNLILIIAGIVALLLVGLILVSGSQSSPANPMTTGQHTLGSQDMRQKCVSMQSASIHGLKFFKYNTLNSKVLGQLLVSDNTVNLNGSGAILIVNSTGAHIEKINLSVKANDSPTNNIWIYKKEAHIKPLALNPGENMPYFVDFPDGSSIVVDVGNISKETKVTIKIDSILISP